MQSLDIRQPAERLSRVVASAILIDCPATAVAATAITSSYFVPTVSTDYSVSTVLSYYAGSIPLLDLLDNYSNRPVLGLILF